MLLELLFCVDASHMPMLSPPCRVRFIDTPPAAAATSRCFRAAYGAAPSPAHFLITPLPPSSRRLIYY